MSESPAKRTNMLPVVYAFDYNVSWSLCAFDDCLVRCVYYSNGQGEGMQCETGRRALFCEVHRPHDAHVGTNCALGESDVEEEDEQLELFCTSPPAIH